MLAVLTTVAVIGLIRSDSPATLNNVAFLAVHISVLAHGVATAVVPTLIVPVGVGVAEADELAA